MRVGKATLISRTIEGWPDQIIWEDVPLGKEYRVDLDSRAWGTLRNLSHPEWGTMEVELIRDLGDQGFPLPVLCLRIES